MADISNNPVISQDYSAFSLPNLGLDENTPAGAEAAQLVRVANTALAAFLEAFPPDGTAITNRSGVDADVSGINALLTGEIDSATLQALAALLLDQLSKTTDTGEATELAQNADRNNTISESRQGEYQELDGKIQQAREKLEEARILEIAGYTLIAAGVALQAIPIVGNIAGAVLIAAGAALLVAAKVITDQANGILADVAAGAAALQDAEAADADIAESAKFEKLQQAFGELAATAITTNINAILTVLGLGEFPNDLAAALEPALAESYTQQGLPPEEAAAQAKIDAQAGANVLSTVLFSTLALTALAGTQGNNTDSATVVQGAINSGLQSASEALQSLVGGDTPIDLNTLGEAIIEAAGDAIEDYFNTETNRLSEQAPTEEAANALRGAVSGEIQESVALLNSVVPGLFTAQQTVQSQVAEVLADNSDQIGAASTGNEPRPLDDVIAELANYVADISSRLDGVSTSTADSLTAQQQGTLAREQVPGLA